MTFNFFVSFGLVAMISLFYSLVCYGQLDPSLHIFLPGEVMKASYPHTELRKVADKSNAIDLINNSASFIKIDEKNEHIFNLVHQFVLNKKDTIHASCNAKIRIKDGKVTFFLDMNSMKHINCCNNDEHLFAKVYLSETYNTYFEVFELQPNINEVQKVNYDLYHKLGTAKGADLFIYSLFNTDRYIAEITNKFVLNNNQFAFFQKSFIYNESLPHYKDMLRRTGLYNDIVNKILYKYIYRSCVVEDIDVQETVVIFNSESSGVMESGYKPNWFKVPANLYEYSSIFSFKNTQIKPVRKDVKFVKIRSFPK